MAEDKHCTVAEARACLVTFRAGTVMAPTYVQLGRADLCQIAGTVDWCLPQQNGCGFDDLEAWCGGWHTVRTGYSLQQQCVQNEVIDYDLSKALRWIWSSDVLLKIEAFAWRLLIDRLPTRTALVQRGLLDQTKENNRVFCLTWQNFTAPVYWVFFSCNIWLEFLIGLVFMSMFNTHLNALYVIQSNDKKEKAEEDTFLTSYNFVHMGEKK